ncbi:MAG: hypothetical protein IPK26_31570 [Planctomycetes bacterium]|nr:hypothetical protein [Planctomycetota bacterium]
MKPKSKKQGRPWWKTLLIALGVLVVLLALFVVAFIFNPLEGEVRDVRDLVPREAEFFARKRLPAEDFANFPEPKFWQSFAASQGWQQLQQGPLVQGLRRDGAERALAEAREQIGELQLASLGFLEPLRDLAGSEVVAAGYFRDPTQKPPAPMAKPWWCLYTRVTWRVRAAWGMAKWLSVPGLSTEDGLLVFKPPGTNDTLWLKRHLDCVMLANNKHMLDQAQRLIDGVEGEEPFGTSAKYTDGIQQRIERWSEANATDPNALEFSCKPNSMRGFQDFAGRWPNAANRDSMNERVLAQFLNLKGWNSLSGALMFEDGKLSCTGEIVLNSHQHTAFQSNFFRAEGQPRKEWLDPFLRMVPVDACAAAALRVFAGDFLHAMHDALLDSERDLINDGLRRCVFQGTQLTDFNDLIERIKTLFAPRTGFVFRRNVPDPGIPVTARSPMPQVAWVFWLKPGGDKVLNDLATMFLNNAAVFRCTPYHLKIENFEEKVTELANPMIPATGEFAFLVFREFFVVSNSGPLIKDILRTRYGTRSILESPEFLRIDAELPQIVNGFVWLRGPALQPVLDDFAKAASADNALPDPDWMAQNRGAAEDAVRRQRFPQFASKAAIPQDILNGEFEQAVRDHLNQLWVRSGPGFTAQDLAAIRQFKAFATLMDTTYLQLELENNYLRFQGKVFANLR